MFYRGIKVKENTGNELFKFLRKLGIMPKEETPTTTLIKVPVKTKEQHKCEDCGTTSEICRFNGYLNCNSCYDNFGEFILDNIKKIVGEKPKNKKTKRIEVKPKTLENFISGLQDRMSIAITTEDYEEASKLRDEIKGANILLTKVKEIKEEIKNLIKSQNFEEAKKVQKELDKIIKECIN